MKHMHEHGVCVGWLPAYALTILFVRSFKCFRAGSASRHMAQNIPCVDYPAERPCIDFAQSSSS